MKHPDQELVLRALARDPAACRTLVTRLTGPIQRQVNAALLRRNRSQRQEVLDLTQEVFRVLLDQNGKILKNWAPDKGASLEGWVALVAERRIASILRSGRQSGWAEIPTDPDTLIAEGDDPGPEAATLSRAYLGQLLDLLRAELSAQGFQMFQWLFVEDKEVEWIVAQAGTSRDAVYAWRARLQKIVHQAARQLDPSASPRSMVEGERR